MIEQGSPGAVVRPADRLLAGFFPAPAGGNPNRIDGAAAIVGAAPTRVLFVPFPAKACKVALAVTLAAFRTTPAAPPAVGGVVQLLISARRDAPTNPPVIDLVTVAQSQLDGAYVVAATSTAGGIEITFAGVAAEAYDAIASAEAFGAT